MNTKLAAVLFSSALVVMGRESHAITATTSPGACSQGPGLLSVYAGVAPSGKLERIQWVYDHWTPWIPMSPASTPTPNSQPAAVSYAWNEGVYDGVCAQYGSEIKCHMMGINGPTFTTPVTDAASSPALITIFTGTQIRVVLFWINFAGQLRYRAYHPALDFWNVPGTLPGAPLDLVSIAGSSKQNPDGIQLCGKTNTTQIKCVYRTNLTTNVAWEVDPGAYSWNPGVALVQAGPFRIMNVVSRSSFDSQLWYTSKFIGWSNPLPIGGNHNSSPAMTNWGGDTLHIFARNASDNDIFLTYYDSGAWAPTWYRVPTAVE